MRAAQSFALALLHFAITSIVNYGEKKLTTVKRRIEKFASTAVCFFVLGFCVSKAAFVYIDRRFE